MAKRKQTYTLTFDRDELHHVHQGLFRQRNNFISKVPAIESALAKFAQAQPD